MESRTVMRYSMSFRRQVVAALAAGGRGGVMWPRNA